MPGEVLLQSSGSAQSSQGDRGAFSAAINNGNEQQVRKSAASIRVVWKSVSLRNPLPMPRPLNTSGAFQLFRSE